MTFIPFRAISTEEAIALDEAYGAHNYAPLPVVVSRGRGAHVWDPEGKEYLDFLSGICSVSQGHCHPRLVASLCEQAQRLTMPSRAFYTENFGTFAKYATTYFGYDRILVMNTGVEAVETAIKLCRKWGYQKKGIAANDAKIIFCQGNFHGRTMAAISASTSEDSKNHFGPFVPNFKAIPFNDLSALEKALSDATVAGFVVEPIQGEAGVIVPGEGFLRKAYQLCKDANVLFIADEVQTGLGRTGKLLACDHEGVRPDIVILGKALSGGMLPVSAILADDPVMLTFTPGDHGSTFGGNPLACAVARTALEIIKEENLVENAARLGELFREGLKDLPSPVLEVRGKGLLNAIQFEAKEGLSAKDICLALKDHGLLTKNTRETIIRFAPPLVIQEGEMREAIAIIRTTLQEKYPKHPKR